MQYYVTERMNSYSINLRSARKRGRMRETEREGYIDKERKARTYFFFEYIACNYLVYHKILQTQKFLFAINAHIAASFMLWFTRRFGEGSTRFSWFARILAPEAGRP